MAKQFKIKDIAALAGVSAGTVDRVIHNRGKVSEKNRLAVERILEEVGYKSNIHTSAISLKKEFHIVITTPTANPGEYWGSIHKGFRHALEEYSDVKIVCSYHTYNQFDVYSCRRAFEEALKEQSDAVVIGPIFIEESLEFCRHLEERGTPYIFVNSSIEGTNPLATYMIDQHSCGQIVGKLLNMAIPDGSSVAVFTPSRRGNQGVQNQIERMKGFEDYMTFMGKRDKIKIAEFSMLDPEHNEEIVTRFLEKNQDVKGIAIMNSRAHIIGEVLKAHDIKDMSLVAFDMTAANQEMLKDGYISCLLCQRPELQGFNAIEHIIEHLLYKKKNHKTERLMPIDIVMKENLPYYKEL